MPDMRTEEDVNQREVQQVYRGSGAIRVRQFGSSVGDHARVLDFLNDKHPDWNPTKDSTFLAELDGRLVGVFAERLIPLVHVFEVEPSLISRKTAEALSNYAHGFTRASGQKEAMFLVNHTNVTIQRFIEERGAVDEGLTHVYTLEVR